jgi:hypothetical protein
VCRRRERRNQENNDRISRRDRVEQVRKTVVYDTDPKSQSRTLWAVAHRHLTGEELPFHVIQYTAASGLAAHAARTKQALGAKHLVFDVGGDTEAQYRQALRECTVLILPISISTIETITLNAAPTAEDVATEADREINSQVLLCGVDHHDTRELAEAREAAPSAASPRPPTVGGDTVTIDVFDVVIHTDFSQAPRSRGIALRRGAR